MTHECSGPEHLLEKKYEVRVRGGPVTDEQLELLRGGHLSLDGIKLLPCGIELLYPDSSERDELIFSIREGRNRQIRRMCQLVGLDVVKLHRFQVGNVRLNPNDIPPGTWRLLKPHESFT